MSRPFAVVHTEDQWLRGGYEGTGFDPVLGTVELAWERPAATDDGGVPAALDALDGHGLAFDPWCRLFHVEAETGRIARHLWSELTGLRRTRSAAEAARAASEVRLHPVRPTPSPADFTPVAEDEPGELGRVHGLAIDVDGRLYVAQHDRRRILVHDLVEQRVCRRVNLQFAPVDLTSYGRFAAALTREPAVVVLDARNATRFLRLDSQVPALDLLAATPSGELAVITAARTADARLGWLREVPGGAQWSVDWEAEVPFATGLTFAAFREGHEETPALVVAHAPGQAFRRFVVRDGAAPRLVERDFLRAPDYDGRGIVTAPDARVFYGTATGFRRAHLLGRRYVRTGRVTTLRLDSRRYQTRWGRVLVEACVPRGAELRVRTLTTDESVVDGTITRGKPAGWAADLPEAESGKTEHPMPPVTLVAAAPEVESRVFRRPTGRELPFSRPDVDSPFDTWEAPVDCAPGRYLWVTLELRGNGRSTPRVRSLRAEHRDHGWLRRLPRVFSDDAEMESFLQRFLGMFDSLLQDLDVRAAARNILLDPRVTPEEALPWLAGWLGLVLDERWPLEARRELVRRAASLFKSRGTVPGLKALLAILLGREAIVIEHFRLRGTGGAFLGTDSETSATSVLGVGFRVGGALGTEGEVAVIGTSADTDPIRQHAHRFTVVVPGPLRGDRLGAVRDALEVHRPAHTVLDAICTVDSGLRAGVGAYLGMSSVVGRSGAFGQLQLDGSVLGSEDVIGRPAPGTRPGSGRVGKDTRIG